MTHHTHPKTASSDTLTWKRLFNTILPLSLTFLMMSGSAPIVTGGIAWKFGPAGERLHLAAFLVCFSTALFFYGPVLAARNVAIRVIVDRPSLFRFAGFFSLCAILIGGLLAVIALVDPVGDFILLRILQNTPEKAALARGGLVAFIPIPFLIILRSLAQGCHINNDQAWYVGAGTFVRLIAMAAFVFGYAVRCPEISGPLLGGMAFLVGIGTEAAFELLMLINKPQWSTVKGKPISYARFAKYSLPLMGAYLLHQLLTPVLIVMINHCQNPAEGLAGYDLLRSTLWVAVSMQFAVQSAVVAYSTSSANFRLMTKFGTILSIAITLCLASVAFTPLRYVIFEDLLQVDNQLILTYLYPALKLAVCLPMVVLGGMIAGGLHTRSGRTGWIAAGHFIGLVMLAVVGYCCDLSEWNGVLFAITGSLLVYSVSMVVQISGLAIDGLSNAFSSATLAEVMEGTPHEN